MWPNPDLVTFTEEILNRKFDRKQTFPRSKGINPDKVYLELLPNSLLFLKINTNLKKCEIGRWR